MTTYSNVFGVVVEDSKGGEFNTTTYFSIYVQKLRAIIHESGVVERC